MPPARRGARPRIEGAKRGEILAAATERFGRDGYEDTKWADIAADVGVGPTALYHYFESKQHCLYVIMDQALDGFRVRFEALTGGGWRAVSLDTSRPPFDLPEISNALKSIGDEIRRDQAASRGEARREPPEMH